VPRYDPDRTLETVPASHPEVRSARAGRSGGRGWCRRTGGSSPAGRTARSAG
jgi:hypothetical protein